MNRNILRISILLIIIAMLSELTNAQALAATWQNTQKKIENLSYKNNFNSPNERIEALFSLYADISKNENPVYATSIGYKGYDGAWSDNSLDTIEESNKVFNQLRQLCSEIDENELNEYNKTYFRLIKQDIDIELTNYDQEMFYFPISQQHGIHQYIPYVFKQHSTANTEDIRNLFKLMETADIQIDNVIEKLTTGISKEFTIPKVTMVGVPDQLQKIIESESDQSPFFEPFKNLDNFSDIQISTFQQRAQNIITAKLIPAYEKLLVFVEEIYIPQCRTDIGIFNLPGGQKKYLSQIQYYTTTDMTAKDIHNLGLLEVKRIKEEMETVKKQTGFKGNLSAFNQFLRTDPQFFHKTREELIMHYRDICKRIDPELIKLFGKLPRLPYGVIPVPDYLEKYSTTAYYQSGSTENGKPGYYFGKCI